jgi:5'-nucleotidase/UDP-sugar diphosphatase
VIALDGNKLTVESRTSCLRSTTASPAIAASPRRSKSQEDRSAPPHSPRAGYSIDQPLAIAPRDLPNTFTDIAAGTILANLVHRRLPQRHEGGHRTYRQRHDARRIHPR